MNTNDPQELPAYWQTVLDGVSALSDGAVAIESLPMRSNETSIAHGLRFEGVGGYPLFAYFTVPRGEGPFPALFQTPGYGSVVGVPAYERRSRYAVMALCHRGQRLSDSGYSAAYPGLLTDGLPGADTYVYRGVVADCLRAFDVFTARPEIDSSRLAVAGMDLAAITTALRPQTPLMLVTAMTLRAAAERAPLTRAYPLQELNNYARTHPATPKRLPTRCRCSIRWPSRRASAPGRCSPAAGTSCSTSSRSSRPCPARRRPSCARAADS